MTNELTDAHHWQECFARYGARLLLFARQWLPDVADAEDAVQDGFVRVWRKRGRVDDDEVGLLFAAVKSAAFDQLRRDCRRRRRETVAAEFEPGAADSLFEHSPGGHELTEINAALAQLAAEQREVVVLKIWGELTFAQIADALRVSPNTVASRYRYALNTLKKYLRPVCHE